MQSRIDSLMEAIVNIVIGLVISTLANHWVLPAVLHVQMSMGQNVLISAIFTAISLVRSYTLRRIFNGRTVWQALRDFWTKPWRTSPIKVRSAAFGMLLTLPVLYPLIVILSAIEERIFQDLNADVRAMARSLRTGNYRA